MRPVAIFGVCWTLSKHIMCSSVNSIFDWQQARQTFIGNSRLCVILLTTQSRRLSPALSRQAGHFFSYFCPFSSPFFPPLFPPQSLLSSLVWSNVLSFFPPSICFQSSPPSVQGWDNLESPWNGGDISLWQCSISPAAYLLTDWINVLYLVWEATCSGSEGYSQAHRPTH